MECLAWIKTIYGNLKTGLNWTYHAFDFEKYATGILSSIDTVSSVASIWPGCHPDWSLQLPGQASALRFGCG
jgi:hypothetical protein